MPYRTQFVFIYYPPEEDTLTPTPLAEIRFILFTKNKLSKNKILEILSKKILKMIIEAEYLCVSLYIARKQNAIKIELPENIEIDYEFQNLILGQEINMPISTEEMLTNIIYMKLANQNLIPDTSLIDKTLNEILSGKHYNKIIRQIIFYKKSSSTAVRQIIYDDKKIIQTLKENPEFAKREETLEEFATKSDFSDVISLINYMIDIIKKM